MNLDTLAKLNDARASRRAAVLVTDIASGEQRLVEENDAPSDILAQGILDRIRQGKSGNVEFEGRPIF